MKKKYLFDAKIKYRTFKKLWNTIPSGGIEPREMCKMLHQLLQEKKLYCWYENSDITISIKPPRGKFYVIKNKGITNNI